MGPKGKTQLLETDTEELLDCMGYLAGLQKAEGLFHRMPTDVREKAKKTHPQLFTKPDAEADGKCFFVAADDIEVLMVCIESMESVIRHNQAFKRMGQVSRRLADDTFEFHSSEFFVMLPLMLLFYFLFRRYAM